MPVHGDVAPVVVLVPLGVVPVVVSVSIPLCVVLDLVQVVAVSVPLVVVPSLSSVPPGVVSVALCKVLVVVAPEHGSVPPGGSPVVVLLLGTVELGGYGGG